MTIPVWPQINFLAEQGSWKLSLSDGKNVSSTDMDSGQTRDRLRFTQVNSPLSFNIVLDKDELQLFNYFVKEILASGTRWFYMPILDGVDYRINLVKLASSQGPEVSPTGYRTYTVALNLIVRELTQIDAIVYEYFSKLGIDSGLKLSDSVTHFVNVTYPHTSAEYR